MGNSTRAAGPAVASMVTWGAVAGGMHGRLDVGQERLPGSNSKYSKEP